MKLLISLLHTKSFRLVKIGDSQPFLLQLHQLTLLRNLIARLIVDPLALVLEIDFSSHDHHVRELNYLSLEQTPSPGQYPIWNTFDGPNPAIKMNALTTSFK